MRYPALDGLRGIAALSVIISHHSNLTGLFDGLLGKGGGQLGVMLFFCLSGFLMARLYIDRPLRIDTFLGFARARIARVIPLYLLVVFASHGASLLYGDATALYAVTSNNLLHHLAFHSGTSVLWTIPVEVQFYALFPVFWLIFRCFGPSVLIAVMIVAALTVALLGYPQWPGVLRACSFFFAGMVVAMSASSNKVPFANWAFVIFFAVYVLSFPEVSEAIGIGPRDDPTTHISHTLWTTPTYVIVITAFLWACLHSSWAEKVLGGGVMGFYGKISYSLYLLHMPILWILDDYAWATARPMLAFAVLLSITTVLAWLSYRFIEHPARQAINRLPIPRIPEWVMGVPGSKFPR